MKNILIVLCTLLLCSCAKIENQNKGKKVFIPENLTIYSVGDAQVINILNPVNNHYIIYTLIDVSCATCLLKLEAWNKFYSEIEDSTVSFIPICHSKDDFELLKYLAENNQIEKLKFPLYLDTENQFIPLNKLLISDTGEFTVLTNSEHKIILSGSPLDDQNLKKEYLSLINTL